MEVTNYLLTGMTLQVVGGGGGEIGEIQLINPMPPMPIPKQMECLAWKKKLTWWNSPKVMEVWMVYHGGLDGWKRWFSGFQPKRGVIFRWKHPWNFHITGYPIRWRVVFNLLKIKGQVYVYPVKPYVYYHGICRVLGILGDNLPINTHEL